MTLISEENGGASEHPCASCVLIRISVLIIVSD